MTVVSGASHYEHADVADQCIFMGLDQHVARIRDAEQWACRDVATLLWRTGAPGEAGAVTEIAGLVAKISREPGLAAGIRNRLGRQGFVESVERRLARNISPITTWREDWDADDYVLQTPGGVFDLRTGQLRPTALSDRNLLCTRVTPDAKMATPVFNEMLLELVHGGPEARDYLLLALSFCVIGEVCENNFFIFLGGAGTGKSTLTGFMLRMLGDYGTTVDPKVFAAAKEQFEEYQKAWLVKKRLVVPSEPGDKSTLNEGMLKRFTGGDEDTAREIRKEPMKYWPKGTIIMPANQLPKMQQGGSPMLRRLRIIEMDARPRVENRRLPAMLDAEAPGVLHRLCTRAYEYLRTRHAPVPAGVTAWVHEHVATASAVAPWADACIEFTGNEEDFISTAELHSEFDRWRNREAGQLGAISVISFGAQFRQWLNRKTYGAYSRGSGKSLSQKPSRGFGHVVLKQAISSEEDDVFS